MALRRVWYRVWQFLASLYALAFPPQDEEARQLLSPAEYALFRRQAHYDRRHALRVLHILRQNQQHNPALFKAALLHDAGKSGGRGRIPLLYRGAIVLAQQQPRLWAWLSRERPAGDLRCPFYLYAVHAARGAELARAAGCPEQVVALIAGHHDRAASGPAHWLQQADRRS